MFDGGRRARRHVSSRRRSPTASAATKKNANVTDAERSAIIEALPRNDQFRLYSPYEMTKAHAPPSIPNTRPSTALSSRFTPPVYLLDPERPAAWICCVDATAP